MSEKTNMMVVMAQIGRAHGLKGEVHAQSFTADPLALTDYGDLTDAKGRIFKISAIRAQGNGLVLRLAVVGLPLRSYEAGSEVPGRQDDAARRSRSARISSR